MYYSDELEIKAIEKVLNSKKLFRYQGKGIETQCSLFEKNFAQFLNVEKSILLSSGTNALVAALYSIGISEGDDVIVPSYTFFATVAAILELKANPIIVNIDNYLSFDLEELKKSITPKTKAIIAVHIDGHPCQLNEIITLCAAHKIQLIEDAAQAVGGRYKGKRLGSIGKIGCFSFNMDKIISCGEGGALVTNDDILYQKAFLYHDSCNQFGLTNKDLYSIEKFSGKSMRASEIQGAMINVQLDRLENILHDLKERKEILQNRLEELAFNIIPSHDPSGECATTIRISLSDPSIVSKMILQLNEIGIKTNSPLLRPGHNVWHWLPLIPKAQDKFQFLPTIDILSKTLLVHVSLEHDINHWKKNVDRIKV